MENKRKWTNFHSTALQGNHDPTKPNESDAGMMFGATIHTLNGLNVKVKRRVHA
jgi:hypothetical protein